MYLPEWVRCELCDWNKTRKEYENVLCKDCCLFNNNTNMYAFKNDEIQEGIYKIAKENGKLDQPIDDSRRIKKERTTLGLINNKRNVNIPLPNKRSILS